MSDETELAEALRRRTQAWNRVNGTIKDLRTGIAERPIAARLKDHATDRALDALDTAKTVALSNPGIIGGVLAALAGWMFRRRLLRAARRLAQDWFGPQPQADKETP